MPVKPPAVYLTPPQYATRLGVHPDKIVAAIRSGEIAAIDLAARGATRPRYRISPQAIEDFERRRSTVPLPKPVRRRRSPTIKSFI